MSDVSFLHLGALFGLTLVSGTIDAMAGGGGLLNVPALLMLGFDPASALATNKFQGTFSSLSATVHFWREGKLHIKDHKLPCLMVFIGGLIGAVTTSVASPQILKNLVPVLLVAISIWLIVQPKLGHVEKKARLTVFGYAMTILPLLGFYDGFFGPATGTFLAMANVFFMGMRLDQATAEAKLYNMAANIAASLTFILGGHIVWLYALVMTAGTLIGANIGARLVIRYGTSLVKPLLVTMSLAMSLKLLWHS